MKIPTVRNRKLSVMLGLAMLALGATALAAPSHGQRLGHGSGPAWHGDIARFHEHDWGVWRGGRWIHSRHDGRLGWWWVVGSAWYFYPTPVYPYPNPWEPPPPPVVAPPPAQYWYYCEPASAYYPYVATCTSPWKQVPATPAASTPVPAK